MTDNLTDNAGLTETDLVFRLFVFQSASTAPRSPPEWIRDLNM